MRTDEILRHVAGPAVLDVGCAGHVIRPGDGAWLHGRLAEHFEVTGIDISETNVAFLRNLGFRDIHVQSAETFELDRKYNTIVAGEVIEHLSNPGQFLARARTHLIAGGRLVLTTPYNFSLMYLLYAGHRFPRTCQNSQHTCWFCPSTLTELASRAGLEVEEWRLVDDYDPLVRSLKYQLYWGLMRALRRFIPDRFIRTTLLMVLRNPA